MKKLVRLAVGARWLDMNGEADLGEFLLEVLFKVLG